MLLARFLFVYALIAFALLSGLLVMLEIEHCVSLDASRAHRAAQNRRR